MKVNPVCILKPLVCVVLLASCTTLPPAQSGDEARRVEASQQAVVTQDPVPQPQEEVVDVVDVVVSNTVRPPVTNTVENDVRPNIRMGTGVFVAQTAADREAAEFPAGDVTLNFESAGLREFIGVIFEDILKENYLVDPKVNGVVTLHTTRPVSREAVLPILESVLEQNAAALVRDRGVYKVIPIAGAEGEAVSPVVGRQSLRSGAGYGVQIVPLAHVAATDIAEILKPFVPKGSAVRVDPARNLLILSGPRYRLVQILETIEIFDVDWLKGMSFGLFPLQYADAATLAGELQQVIGSEGESPFAGTVRLVPIARLNAVLVITHQPRYLAEVRKLIEQFDWGSEASPGRRLYVYYLENGKADSIAGVLQELYGQSSDGAQDGAGSTAGFGTSVFRSARELTTPVPQAGMDATAGDVQEAVTPAASTAAADTSVAIESRGPVTIIADPDNNAILVMASPGDYRVIEAAIGKLDIPPRQVLINATIAEVTLSGGLDHGVRWFLDNNRAELAFDTPLPTGAGGDGLTLALLNGAGDVRFFFDLLETESGVKFLSAPQVLVRDNQTATIRVGDQIPVVVRSSSGTNLDDLLVTEVQFRDTGTLLTVTPRINAGGQVALDVSLEVSLPGTEPAIGGGGNVSIAQRSIDSAVTVQSGQTVVMGGLIRESSSDSTSGIPVLMGLPVLGNLFSSKSKDSNRTELLVTINPVVVEDQHAAQAITRELRNRMRKAASLLEPVPQPHPEP